MESAASPTTVGIGEGTAVWLPEPVPVVKVVADTSVVAPITVVDPTTEVEVKFPGLTRTVVVVEAEAYEEGPAISSISIYHNQSLGSEDELTSCWSSSRTTSLRNTESAYDRHNTITSPLLRSSKTLLPQ